MVASFLILTLASTLQTEIQEAESILNRVLDASLRSPLGRPALLDVSISGLRKSEISQGAFSARSAGIGATFHRNPLKLSTIQIQVPRNRSLEGQSRISQADQAVIARNVARLFIAEPYAPAPPKITETGDWLHFTFAGQYDGTYVDTGFVMGMRLDPWSGCVVYLTAPIDYRKLLPPNPWSPGVTPHAAYIRAYEAYAATSPLPFETIVSESLVLRRPNFPETWSQLTAEHRASAAAWRLMPFYRVVMEAQIGAILHVRVVYVDARTGLPTAMTRDEIRSLTKAGAPASYIPGGSVKIVGTGDEIVVGAKQEAKPTKGSPVNIVLREGDKRLVLAKAWPGSRVLEIQGVQYPYFGRIDIAKLKKLKPLPAGVPIKS